MGHTFSNLLIHVIFGTKERRPTVTDTMRPRLYEYLGGIMRKEIGTALAIGGTADHVHLLLVIKPEAAVAHAVQRLKSLSSGWAHRTFPAERLFAWQEGYGAFSVSPSNQDAVIEYIFGQVEHHKKLSFDEEFLAFLKRHGADYVAQHVWD